MDREARLLAAYTDLEAQLLSMISRAAYEVDRDPMWAKAMLWEVQALRRKSQAAVDAQQRLIEREVRHMVAEEWEQASWDAYDELEDAFATHGPPPQVPAPTVVTAPVEAFKPVVNHQAIDQIVAETTDTLTALNRRILRAVPDEYRRVVQQQTIRVASGVAGRRQSLEVMVRQMANRGITGFTDNAGRKWGIDTYAEMALRTSNARARQEAHRETYMQMGADLVVVSAHPNPSPQCAPFQGRVLSLSGGNVGIIEAEDAVTGDTVQVEVVASLDDAIRRGYQHPNCRHRESVYFPGQPLPRERPDPGHKGYKAEQKQRYYERQIRASRRMEAVAQTPEALRAAVQRRDYYESKIRSHTKEWRLKRRKEREQLRAPAAG